MFQELVDVVNSKGYSMDIHFMPDDNYGNRVHLRVLDADYRIYECYTNSIRMYGLAEIVLDNIRAYENKLAQALEEDDFELLSPETLAKLKPADEVSETRMSYYWVYNGDISPVFIAVKVDEYREVVSAGYVNREHEVCPGCAGYGKPCTRFSGTQEQLDKSTWIKVNMDNSIVLLPTEYALVQKLPSEVANDN